jgi:hypothetical protein
MNIKANKANTTAVYKSVSCAGILLLMVGCSFYIVHRRAAESPRPTINAPAQSTGSSPGVPDLRITGVVQHGHILEIKGFTEPGATVMINGQPAATIFDRNSFRQFIGPLPRGATIIAITSQNSEGGVNTQQLAFSIE